MAVEQVNSIDGTESDDTIEGTDQKDKIRSFGGNDVIYAHGGDDYIDAGTGDNVVYAASGNDEIYSGGGNDIIWGDSWQPIQIEAPSEGIENSFDAVELSYDYLITDLDNTLADQGGSYDLSESLTNALNTTDESDLGINVSTDNAQLSINDVDPKRNGVGSTDITVIGASEGDAVKSWVANGNTAQLNAQVALVSDKGYGVSNKNGNNGGQTSAIEGNESILFGLGKASSADFTISSFNSSQTLTGQWIAYSEDRFVVAQGDLTDEITINSPYVEFDAHKSGGRGSENAFYVKVEATPVETTAAAKTIPQAEDEDTGASTLEGTAAAETIPQAEDEDTGAADFKRVVA